MLAFPFVSSSMIGTVLATHDCLPNFKWNSLMIAQEAYLNGALLDLN